MREWRLWKRGRSGKSEAERRSRGSEEKRGDLRRRGEI